MDAANVDNMQYAFQRWDSEQESWQAANDMPEVKTEQKPVLISFKKIGWQFVKQVRVRFCAAAVDTRFLAVIGGEMDGEVKTMMILSMVII